MTSLWPSLQRLESGDFFSLCEYFSQLIIFSVRVHNCARFPEHRENQSDQEKCKRLKGKAACTDFFLFVSLSLDKSYEAAFKKNWYVLCCKGPLLYKQNIVTIGMGSLMQNLIVYVGNFKDHVIEMIHFKQTKKVPKPR